MKITQLCMDFFPPPSQIVHIDDFAENSSYSDAHPVVFVELTTKSNIL